MRGAFAISILDEFGEINFFFYESVRFISHVCCIRGTTITTVYINIQYIRYMVFVVVRVRVRTYNNIIFPRRRSQRLNYKHKHIIMFCGDILYVVRARKYT